MGVGMTRTQEQFIKAIRRAIDDEHGQWEISNGSLRGVGTIRGPIVRVSLRHSEHNVTTPETVRELKIWDEPTFSRHVFITVLPFSTGWTIILGVAHAPWGERRDSTITFKRAFEILANPASVFS